MFIATEINRFRAPLGAPCHMALRWSANLNFRCTAINMWPRCGQNPEPLSAKTRWLGLAKAGILTNY